MWLCYGTPPKCDVVQRHIRAHLKDERKLVQQAVRVRVLLSERIWQLVPERHFMDNLRVTACVHSKTE